MRSKKKIKRNRIYGFLLETCISGFVFGLKIRMAKVSIKICRSDGDTLSMTRQDARILSIAIGAVIEL